jgi:molybdenum cofactor cytidylyltransferase
MPLIGMEGLEVPAGGYVLNQAGDSAPVQPVKRSAMSKKISVVILAAGKSSRFYQTEMKLLSYFNGKPLIRWAVDAAVASSAHSTIVVTGHVREQIEATLHDSPVILVHNGDHTTGLASSLRALAFCFLFRTYRVL